MSTLTLHELGLGQDDLIQPPRESFAERWARMRAMIRGPQKPSVIVHKDEPLPPPIQPLAKPAPAPKTTVTVSAPAIDTRVLVGAAVLGGLVVMVMGGKKK